jgi:hypothetical protein
VAVAGAFLKVKTLRGAAPVETPRQGNDSPAPAILDASPRGIPMPDSPCKFIAFGFYVAHDNDAPSRRKSRVIPGFLAFDFLCALSVSVVDGFLFSQ